MGIKVGDKYHYRGQKMHVVAIIEDCGERLCVLKQWNMYSQRWKYLVQDYKFVEEDITFERRCAESRRKHNQNK